MLRPTIFPPEVMAPGAGSRAIARGLVRGSALLRATLVACALAPTVAGAQHPLTSLPMDDPAYETLQGLERTGCVWARVSAYRPYLVRDVRQAVRRAAADSSCTPTLVDVLRARFATDTFDIFTDGEGVFDFGAAATVRASQLSNGEFRPLWLGVRPKTEGDPPVAGILQARLVWGSRNVVAVAEGVGYSHRRNDPSVHQRAVRRTTGAIDFGESYINAQLGKRLTLSFGRAGEAWLGEGRESLVLSAWGPALDRIMLSGRWRRVEARALYGTLSQVLLTPQLDTVITETRAYRYLVAHALTIRPTHAVEISVGETALLARAMRTLDLAYANPFMVYVVTQNDTSRTGAGPDDNLQVFGAARVHSGASALDAELLIDDIQIDAPDRKYTQDALAWRVRGTQGVPFRMPASGFAEYRHVNSYTYLRDQYSTVYQNYDAPLGSELGPDADMWRLGGELWPSGAVRVEGGVGGWRQGAQRLAQRPSRSAVGHANEPYPTVTADRPFAQHALLVNGALSYVKHPLTLSLRAEGARVRNPANQADSPASYLRLQLIGRYAYHIP